MAHGYTPLPLLAPSPAPPDNTVHLRQTSPEPDALVSGGGCGSPLPARDRRDAAAVLAPGRRCKGRGLQRGCTREGRICRRAKGAGPVVGGRPRASSCRAPLVPRICPPARPRRLCAACRRHPYPGRPLHSLGRDSFRGWPLPSLPSGLQRPSPRQPGSAHLLNSRGKTVALCPLLCPAPSQPSRAVA